MPTPEIIVGIDGSPESERALTWAANEAVGRRAELLILNVYTVESPIPMGVPVVAEARRHAEELVASSVASVRATAPDLPVRGRAVFGHAAQILVRAATDGATVVVANRGRGGLASLLLGSVSQHVALHAHGPVVVVRGRPDSDDGPVVVGVDGSPESETALQTAFEEAAIRRTGLVAVRAYRVPAPAYAPDLINILPDPDEQRDMQHSAVAEMVAPWARKYPDVDIRCTAVEGSASTVLTRQSGNACLVVVGSRGHGGVAGLLLGSVGQHLLHHAQCPVLVARARA